MMRRTLAIVMLTGALGCSRAADEVRYTLRMELKPSAAPAEPADPRLASIGALVTEMMVPGGSVEMTVTMGAHGTRVEANKPLAGLPEGAAMLQRPDGSVVVLNAAEKTYWTAPPAEAADITAEVKRTGEFSTVAGERAERVTFRFSVPAAPEAASAGLPPLTIEGDAWVADRFKSFTAVTAKAGASPSGLAIRQLAELGLSVKQVMRSAMFGGQQIESIVTAIDERPATPALFEIPAGFREVPPPGRVGG